MSSRRTSGGRAVSLSLSSASSSSSDSSDPDAWISINAFDFLRVEVAGRYQRLDGGLVQPTGEADCLLGAGARSIEPAGDPRLVDAWHRAQLVLSGRRSR